MSKLSDRLKDLTAKISVPKSPQDWEQKTKTALKQLGNVFLAGLAVGIPVVVTIWVLNLAYQFVAGISAPWLRRIFGRDIPGLAFAVTLLLVLLLGFTATNVFGKRILEAVERWLLRIPLVATIYAGTKQVIDSFKGLSSSSGSGFKRVVYVEYPSVGCRLIGFVTGQYRDPTTGSD